MLSNDLVRHVGVADVGSVSVWCLDSVSFSSSNSHRHYNWNNLTLLNTFSNTELNTARRHFCFRAKMDSVTELVLLQ